MISQFYSFWCNNNIAMQHRIAVIGGSGRVGRSLVSRLSRRNGDVISIQRRPLVNAISADNVSFAIVNTLDDIGIALSDATHVVNCGPVSLNGIIYRYRSERIQRIVTVGSARIYTNFADAAAQKLRDAQDEFEKSGLPGVMLHPTMIYGGGDRNISRIARYLDRFSIVPLPDCGRSLIQPIHFQDVVSCIESALFSRFALGAPIVLAGPHPMPFRVMIEMIAHGIGRKAHVISLPASLLAAGATMARFIPGLPAVTPAEVHRLLEDKAFDISAMLQRLAVMPREFAVDRSILSESVDPSDPGVGSPN
jgi:nucleoside-diphosphate-sugar epimerase